MTTQMPVIFVSHGSPMLALDDDAGASYQQWAESLPQPQALLVVSAHWETPDVELGETVRHEELIYDFSGFPDALYELHYPAPGAPQLAVTVSELLRDVYPPRMTTRGIDHGVWVPLVRMWPEANIPVLQLSLPRSFDERALLALGKRLGPLRDQGVLIIGSGVLSHNLREAFTGHHETTPDWVVLFDQWVERHAAQPDALVSWRSEAPYAARNHPTPEHFLPLLIVAGAAGADVAVSFPITGYEYGVLTRRCVQYG